MDSNYPFRTNGYIYSKKTQKGFLRMQRQGIPRPLFAIQNKLAKILEKKYKALAVKLMKDLKDKCSASDIVLDKAPDDDSTESLMRYIEELSNEALEENKKIADKANLMSVADTLQKEWLSEEAPETDLESWRTIDRVFKLNQKDYLQRLFKDAGSSFKNMLVTFSVDKRKFFNDNMEAVRKLYVDNSLERIQGEEDYIKRKILERITDYATNKTDTLKLDDLTKLANETGHNMARLFARDQMQRFNKACTLSTFRSAGVTKVKWVTANDGRVRKVGHMDRNGVYHRPHTELQGMVFDVNDLPIEIDDYNCRCGLVPVEWEDDE